MSHPFRGPLYDEIHDAREEHEARAFDAATRPQALGVAADFEDAVIARDMTREQLADIARSPALRHVRVKLRADGTLLVTKLPTYTYTAVVMALRSSLGNIPPLEKYLVSCGMLHCGETGATVLQPDAVLVYDGDDHDRALPFAVCEIDVERRTCRRVVEAAVEYLSHIPSLVFVLALKVFPPIVAASAHARTRDHLRLSALVMVVRRAGDPSGVRVTQLRSFGNAAVPPSALDGLLATELLAIDCHTTATSRDLTTLAAALEIERVTAKVTGSMDVEMPRGSAPIALDLEAVRTAALCGWARDEQRRHANEF